MRHGDAGDSLAGTLQGCLDQCLGSGIQIRSGLAATGGDGWLWLYSTVPGWVISTCYSFLFFSIHFTSFRSQQKQRLERQYSVFFSQLAPHPTVRSGDFSPWHGRWRSVGVAHHSVVLPSIPHGQTIACGKGSFKSYDPCYPSKTIRNTMNFVEVHSCISRP